MKVYPTYVCPTVSKSLGCRDLFANKVCTKRCALFRFAVLNFGFQQIQLAKTLYFSAHSFSCNSHCGWCGLKVLIEDIIIYTIRGACRLALSSTTDAMRLLNFFGFYRDDGISKLGYYSAMP